MRFLLILCFFPLFAYSQSGFQKGQFLLKGLVSNATQNFFEFSVTSFIRSGTQSVLLQPDGRFEQTIPIENNQNLTIVLNDELLLQFMIKDQDTIYMNWDATNHKKTFSIKGKNELRTKELAVQQNQNFLFFDSIMHLRNELYEKRNELTRERKFALINNLYNKEIKTILDSAGFFTFLLNSIITDLHFRYSNLLLSEKLVPDFKLKMNETIAADSRLPEVLLPGYDYTILNENWFWTSPEYRQFIYNRLRFFKPFTGWHSATPNQKIPFHPTIDEYYYANAFIVFPAVKEWFITQSIIDGFAHYAFEDVEKIYFRFIEECSSDYLKNILQKHYAAIKRLKPGNPAPSFTLKNEKGQNVSLTDFTGKTVYIDFWGVSCGPCIYEIEKHIPNLHKKYKEKDIVFINICVDANEKQWKDALGKYKLNGINLIAEGWDNHPVCQAYNVTAIPHNILIDKKGAIANNNAPRASELLSLPYENGIDVLLK